MTSGSYIITELAKFLRLNGEKVTKNECKLSLTTSVLCLLNNLFDNVFISEGQELHLMSSSNIDVEHYEDLKFLFHFIKRASSLKVIHGMHTIRGGIDLSKFSNLKVVELHKVPMHLIVGLSELSSQVEVVICQRSIYFLKEIFGNATMELTPKAIWTQLKELNVSYNYISRLDHSLGLLPNVEFIDASHNNLRRADELQILEKLVLLNLGYNALESVPLLSGLSYESLRVLCLRNNALEDLEGLEFLQHLEELDVRCNCISEHSALISLQRLPSLKSLQLEGNPVYFHKYHRELASKYIHPAVVAKGFQLNGELLLLTELMITGTPKRNAQSKTINVHQTAINVIIEDVRSSIEQSYSSNAYINYERTADNSIEVDNSVEVHSYRGKEEGNNVKITNMQKNNEDDNPETFYPNKTITDDSVETISVHKMEELMSHQQSTVVTRKSPKIKKHKMKVAEISEPEEIQADGTVLFQAPSKEMATEITVPTHVKTKQLLERRRKELKEGWLVPTTTFRALVVSSPDTNVSQSALESNSTLSLQTVVSEKKSNEALSIPCKIQPDLMEQGPQVPPNTPAYSDSTQTPMMGNISKSLCDKTEKAMCADENVSESTRAKQNTEHNELLLLTAQKLNSSANMEDKRRFSEQSDGIEVLVPHVNMSQQELIEAESKTANNAFHLETHKLSESSSDDGFGEESDSEDESEENLFMLDKVENGQSHSIFVKLGKIVLREVDSNSGKHIDSLYLRSLSSIKMETAKKEDDRSEYCLSLSFDTVKASRQKRTYVFEDSMSAKDLMSRLKPYAAAKALEEAVLGALQCMNCHSQFSKQGAQRKTVKAKNPFNTVDNTALDGEAPKEYLEETAACPNCGSTVLVEMETLAMPSMDPSSSSHQKSLLSSGSYHKAKKKKLESSKDDKSDTSSVSSSASNRIKNVIYGLIKTSKSSDRKSEEPKFSSTPMQKADSADINSSRDKNQGHKNWSDDPYSPTQPTLSRNVSGVTITSTQSSIAVISDTESSLDAIPEAEKQNLMFASSMMDENLHQSYASPTLKGSIAQDSTVTVSSTTERGVRDIQSYQTSRETEVKFSLSNSVERDSAVEESLDFLHLIEAKEQISSDTFISIDHRLKLYLEVCKFENDEILQACLKADVVPLSDCKEFQGLLVISCKRIFIMKFLKENSERYEKDLKLVQVLLLKHLQTVKILLGSQGFSITFDSKNKGYVFLVRDADRCNCFISLITEIFNQRLPESEAPQFTLDSEESVSQVKAEIFSTYFSQNKNEEEDVPEILLHMFAFCNSEGSSERLQVCIVVTPGYVFLSSFHFNKSKAKEVSNIFRYKPIDRQKMEDLSKLILSDDLLHIQLPFEDEVGKETSRWSILTETQSSTLSLISAVKDPWEKINGFELPLCNNKH